MTHMSVDASIEPEEVEGGIKVPPPGRPATFVVFGATGDLARRKIIPALYQLHRRGMMDPRSIILGVARDADFDDTAFRSSIRESVIAAGGAAADGADGKSAVAAV